MSVPVRQTVGTAWQGHSISVARKKRTGGGRRLFQNQDMRESDRDHSLIWWAAGMMRTLGRNTRRHECTSREGRTRSHTLTQPGGEGKSLRPAGLCLTEYLAVIAPVTCLSLSSGKGRQLLFHGTLLLPCR